MNKYRLSKHPSSYYCALFFEEAIVVHSYREGGYYLIENGKLLKVNEGFPGSIRLSVEPEHGFFSIKAGELEFDIYLESSDLSIPPEVIELTRDVLSHIVEMDTAARSRPDQIDYEEQLAYVNISRSEIELHYYSTTVNTEWGAYFKRDANGTFQFDTLG